MVVSLVLVYVPHLLQYRFQATCNITEWYDAESTFVNGPQRNRFIAMRAVVLPLAQNSQDKLICTVQDSVHVLPTI